MLSFWPSLTLLAFFLAIFLECRAVGGRVTIPFSGFLSFFAYGCVGASLISLLLQQVPWLQFSPVENARADLVMPAAWITGPFIEELAKILPVLVLAFFTSAWRRLSIADLTVAGFASGAGFGFVESNLEALANGKLPSFQHLWLFGYQGAQSGAAGDYSVYFAGHAVYPALFALAAGIGLRLFPIRRAYAWIPAALVFVVMCFDHSLYNWKILHPASATGGAFLEAARPIEVLYLLTLHGRLEVFLLPIALIAAQIVEGRLCTKALGRRADLLLPFEFGRLAVNEWAVAIMRVPYGRAAFAHTLAYFRRRRALALATLEVNRNPANRTLGQYQRLLEQRLLRERAILADPPTGTWFPPRPVLERNLKDWVWRMRWVLGFSFVFVLLFMVDVDALPAWLKNILLDNAFAAIVVGFGFSYAALRMYEFILAPKLDPVASEGVAYADRYTRMLLLGASIASGISPALSLLVGWKVIAPGAAYLSGYFAGWIGQGGNLYSVMGLGAMGGALEAEPGPIGGALRDEIEAGEVRIHRLEKQIQKKITLALPGRGREAANLKLDELLELTARLDAERAMQGRRVRALDACEREAVESRVEDFGQAIEAVKAEFELLKAEFDTAAEAERRRLAGFEQGFNRYLAQILRETESYSGANRTLRDRLRDLRAPRKDVEWALRIAQSRDESTLPLIVAFLPDLERFATESSGERAGILNAGIERIRGLAFARPEEEIEPPAPEKPAEAVQEPQVPEPEAPIEPDEPPEPEAVAVAPKEPQATQDVEAVADQPELPDAAIAAEPEVPVAELEAPVAQEEPVESLALAPEQPVEIEPEPTATEAMPVASDIDWIPIEPEIVQPVVEPPVAFEPEPAATEPPLEPVLAVADPVPLAEKQLFLPLRPQLLRLAAPVEASEPAPQAAEPEAALLFADVELPFTENPPASDGVVAIALPAPVADIETPAAPQVESEKPRDLLYDLLLAIKSDLYVPGEVKHFVAPKETRAPEEPAPLQAEIAPAVEIVPAESEAQSETVQPVVVDEIAAPALLDVEPQTSEELDPDASTPEQDLAIVAGPALETTSVEAAPDIAEPEEISANTIPYVNAPGWSPEHGEDADVKQDGDTGLRLQDVAPAHEFEPDDAGSSSSHASLTGAPEPEDALHAQLREIHELTVIEIEQQLGIAEPQAQSVDSVAPELNAPSAEEANDADVVEQASPEDGAVSPSVEIEAEILLEPVDEIQASAHPEFIEAVAEEPLAEVVAPAATRDVDAPAAFETIEVPDFIAPAPVESVAEVVAPSVVPDIEAPAASEVLEAAASPADTLAEVISPPVAIDVAQAETPLVTEPVTPEIAEAPAIVPEPAPALNLDKVELPLPAAEAAVESAELPNQATDEAPASTTAAETVEVSSNIEIVDLEALPASEPATAALDEIVEAVEIVEAIAEPESTPSDAAPATETSSEAQTSLPQRTHSKSAEAPVAAPDAAPVANAEAARNEYDLDAILAKLLRLEAAMRGPEERADTDKAQDSEKPDLSQDAFVAPVETAAAETPVAAPKPVEEIPSALASPEPQAAVAATAPVTPPPQSIAPELPIPSDIKNAPIPKQESDWSESFDISAPIFETGDDGTESELPRAEAQTLDRAPAELEQTGLQRGIGRGKFAKPADKKSATSTAAATATVAFRSSKFYGNANAAKASLAGPAKDGSVIVQQATSSSIRSAKFFNSSSEGHVDTSDRTPAVAPTRAAAPATATKSLLADTLAEYFAKKGEAPPPMHTVDSETLGEVIDSGRLETTRKGSAPWTFSGIPRRGDFAIRLKRGSDRFIEFIPSNVSFGQTPRYYPRRVGVGTAQTYIPVEHLEYFDVDAHDWLPLKR